MEVWGEAGALRRGAAWWCGVLRWIMLAVVWVRGSGAMCVWRSHVRACGGGVMLAAARGYKAGSCA